MTEEKIFYTVAEVARILRVSEATVKNLLEKGELKGRKVGRQWRVFKADLDRYTQSS